jgi:uncharacterized protein (DUF58 family)
MKSLKAYISILKKVKNRPTKFFLFLIIAIVILFLQAFMHNYNIVFLVMFFLVGVAGASSIYGVLNLYYINAKLLSFSRFFANTDSTYKLSVINNSKNISYDITLTCNDQSVYIKSIYPHHFHTVSLVERFDKRGEAVLKDIKLKSYFPLPHELKYKDITIDKKVVVYAKPEGVSLFNIYNKNSAINGEIDEFDGIKKFNQGDSTSYIHWASLAKNDSLMIKNFLYEDESKKLHFNFKTMSGTDEERLSQLTLWVLECEKNTLEFSINLGNDILDSKEVGIDEILETIAKY